MTELLEQAFAKAAQLSPAEQDRLADWLLKELASEARWDQLFNDSPEVLAKLGAEALEEHRRGETELLDPDKL